MKTRTVFAGALAVGLIAWLLYRAIDNGISLEYTRAQTRTLSQNCEVLATMVSSMAKGKTVAELKALAPPTVLVKEEAGRLTFDSVFLVVRNGRVDSVDKEQSCR